MKKYILFIDGDCVACNRAAEWIASRDINSEILFSPNNSNLAKYHKNQIGYPLSLLHNSFLLQT